jgi:hypothetical protein
MEAGDEFGLLMREPKRIEDELPFLGGGNEVPGPITEEAIPFLVVEDAATGRVNALGAL